MLHERDWFRPPPHVNGWGWQTEHRLDEQERLTAWLNLALAALDDAPLRDEAVTALAWLTENVFVGTGARFPDRVEMRFFRVA